LIYGLEGRDYVKKDDGTVNYPEGQDSATVPYTAQLSCGTLGNFFIMYPMQGTKIESLDWELEQNKNAELSIAMGFVFDSSKVATEYTAVTNVIDQYLPGLSCGSVDPATELPVFLQRLNEAGLGTIIAEKQAQLDAWFAENKK
jgi:putative aldouronate transport system substrate-binding protein